MPNSSRGRFGRGTGTVTVIEQPVMRSYIRKAKIVFYVVLVITTVLTATVAASRWQPVLALFAGLVAGTVIASVTAGIVAAWPVIRAIWWWAPETGIAGSLIVGWVELADHTSLYWRLAAVFVITGIPAAFKPVRDRINQVLWCLVTRHRIRTCFSEFIITNTTGSLPLILWARPTPVGERVWIWLRPGLSMDDLQNRLDKIAVACWASTALAEVASRSNAAFVRLDIKRRDVLTGTVSSPLLGMIKSGAPASERDDAEIPAALDLPEVPASEVITTRPVPLKRPDAPRWPDRPSSPAPAASDGSDVSDWI
jgi:hypothetical protein